MTNEGFNNLRFAILVQAVNDYVWLKSGCILPSSKNNLDELSSFFNSQYFEMLSNIPKDVLLSKANERANKCSKPLSYNILHLSKGYCLCDMKSKEPIPDTYRSKYHNIWNLCAKFNGLMVIDYKHVRSRDEVHDDYDY